MDEETNFCRAASNVMRDHSNARSASARPLTPVVSESAETIRKSVTPWFTDDMQTRVSNRENK